MKLSETTRFLKIAAASLIMAAFVACSAVAQTKDWPFTVPGNYTYDSTKIDVSGGMAGLITQGWYNDCYKYRREIVIDNTTGGAQADYQVRIQLDSSNFDFASAAANGFDIRFTNSDKVTPIDFWREGYNFGASTATFWVEIPVLNAAATQSIWIYYGDACAAPTDGSVYTNVFFHVGEYGTMTQNPMGTTWDAVNFTAAMDVNPVVVSSIQTAVDSPNANDRLLPPGGNNCGGADGYADGTAVPVVRNVTTNGFQMNSMTKSIDCDAVHGVETIGWLAMEQGTYYVGDRLFRVFTQTMNKPAAAENFANVNFGYTFPDVPVILPQVQTYNNTATNSVRMRNGGVSSIQAFIEGEQDNTTFANNETVGFIVADQAGADDILGLNLSDAQIEGELGSTPEGGMQHIWQIQNLQNVFFEPPVVILKAQTNNGGDNGHERLQSISTTNFEQRFSENFYAYTNSYDGNHFNDEGGSFIALGRQFAGASRLIYARKYAASEPSATVAGTFEEYNLDPAIRPVTVDGVSFAEVTAFSHTLGPGTGSVQYQISNDGAVWHYWNGANWVVSNLSYAQSNSAATVNANIAQYDNDQGQGTFYFRAILHAPTVTDDIALDHVSITYTIPPPAPDIFGIAPNPGLIGGTVTITGGDFGATQAGVGGKVYFNGCDAGAASAWSDNSITVTVPTCATNGPVTVFANGYLSNEFNWTIAVPSITFLDPASGDFYQLVWIYGDNFGHVQGNSYVTFQSGLYAQVLSWSNGAIRIVVPAGAVSGDVEVVTAGGASNGVTFNITPDQSRWPFTYAANYSYNSALITVTGGQAELKPINVPTWYDRRWLYRRLITINNTTGGPLTNFVVDLNLNNTNFSFANARTNGEDIRLMTSDGTTLQNYWVESWNQAGQTARVWLRCGTLAAGTNYFYIYYGNSAAPSLSDYTTTLHQIGEVQKNATTNANNWTNNVAFTNAFPSAPVVFAHMQTRNNSNEAHTRVRNITTTKFDVAVESSRTITHSGNETMGWIALRPGAWEIGGARIMAGTQANVDEDAWATVNYPFSFSAAPGVIAMQQTVNIYSSAQDSNDKSQVRMRNIGANNFQIRIEPDDDAAFDYDPRTETIGYIAADLATFDTALPLLKGQMQQSTVETPNVFYYEWIDITSAHTAAPVVLPAIGTANGWVGSSVENTAHSRIKSVTTSRFQLQLEECDDCTEGHAFEDVSWLAMDSGLIWGRQYINPMPAAAVGGEQVILYSTAAPTIEPATDGEYFDGLAGFYQLEGYENVGSIRYQITNDPATSTFYWYDGANWATATVGNTAQTNTSIDVNDYIPLFDAQYGTGTFFFKAYLISDGFQLVQVDGIGIIERSEILSNYNWATSTTPPPIFFGDFVNAGINPNQEFLLAIQVAHDGATGTYNFQLQYQEDPFGTPGPWTSINLASAKWKAVNGAWGAHDDTVFVADFANSPYTGTAIDGVYSETGIVNTFEFASGQFYAEFWYAIIPDATTANKEYQFRVVNGTSSANFAYKIYPKTGPPPDPITLFIDAPYTSAGVKYTDTPILDLQFTCTDQPNALYGDCDASDGMRLGCSLLGVNSVATQSYVVTPPAYSFNLGAPPVAAECTAADGQKNIYLQAQNERTYLQVNPATDTIILDTTAPDISTATLFVTSSQDDYLKGTTDGVVCDPSLAPACTVWFNSNAGQGAGQLIYVLVDALAGGNIDQNPDTFGGSAAFNDTPPMDTSAAADWLVDNYSVEAGHGDELGVTFTFTDKVTKTDTFTIDFQWDGQSPDTIASAQVTAWDAAAKNTNFSYYQWINYSNPYFEWANPADRPYGALQSSGFWRYQSWLSTDPTFVPSTATLANFLEATGPLENGTQYYVVVTTNDYVTNSSTPTVSYAFRYDGVDPIFDYNSPATGTQTIWYSQDPGAITDIDVLWSSGSPLVDYNYRINAGAWQSVFSGSQSSDYTNDWALNWALLPEGPNSISISAHDESTNGATETYAATTSGFQFRKDISPPNNPAAPVNAWDLPAKVTAFINGGTYNVPQPYFEWAAPTDNPAGVDTVDNAGVAGYYVGFSTDPNYNPATAEYQTAATYTAATAAVECTTYYLRIRTGDNAVPTNGSAAATAFQFLYSQAPVINDNQAGDDTWYSANPGAIYDVDAEVNPLCVGNLDYGQYTIFSAAAGGGALIKDWTNFYGPGLGVQSFTSAWGITAGDFVLLQEGINNYISVRANDDIGSFVSYSTDVFYIRKDISAPDLVAAGTVGAWEDDSKADVMVSGNIYDYENPYFEWGEPDDNPNPGTAMNAGVAMYYATLSLDPAADPSVDPDSATMTTRAFYATPTSCGATYTLIIVTADAATPTANLSAPVALFEYYLECKAKPDYFVVRAEEDGAITEDAAVTEWCAGGACSPACTGNYCSNTTKAITAKPEYVKFDNGGPIQETLTKLADNTGPGNLQWSWDAVNNRIMLFNDPSAATVTYTPANGSEKVCAYIYDDTDTLIATGKYANADFVLELSQAPGSGSDITENLSSADTGFSSISLVPGGNIKYLDTTYIGGKLKKGAACVRLTADSLPTDSPMTPLRVDGTLIDPDTSATYSLTLTAGASSPAFVTIRGNEGVSATDTSFSAVTAVTDIWNPSPNDPDLTITLNPVWGFGGDRVAFVSRQNNPCGGAAATGTTPFDNFNIYIRTHNAGVWTDCIRLTRNTTDGATYYGPLAASEIAFSPSDDKVVFAATDIGGTGADRLYWVSATSAFAGAATGTQFDIAVSDPLMALTNLAADANPGDNTVTVTFLDPVFAIGQTVFIGEQDFMTGEYTGGETAVIQALGADTITFDAPLAGGYSAFTASTLGIVQFPVTYDAVGQALSPLAEPSWYDPNWSPTAAQSAGCTDPANPAAGAFGDALALVSWSPTGSADETGPAGGYANEGNDNPNIIMLYGAKTAAGLYAHGVSDIAKITDFTGNTIQPLKPKWSPDCSKLAFLAWDRTLGDTPSRTSVYVINLTDSRPGWATASLPIDSLTATGVYAVYDYNSRNLPAYFPNWSADGKLVSFSLDTTNSLDLLQSGADNDTFVSLIYSGVDFDTYLEYIEDQPNALGGIIGPQIVGAATSTAGMRNEFGLAQCPGSFTGSSCNENPPGSGNYAFTLVSQTSGSSGALRELTLDNVSTVTANGGLLFLDGMVTAVFPPGVVSSDTVFWNEWPTAYCLGAGPASQTTGGGAGNCPIEPTGEFIVNAGEAREFFPDGTSFESHVRLIFRYCDNDTDGFVDAGTEGTQISGFTYNTGAGQCEIGGAPTSGGTIDADSLAVYNWDDTAAQWVKLEGTVDKANKTITVYSTHFSRYDTFGFRAGGQPAVITPLQLSNPHTYPNPWRTTDGVPVKFAADAASGDGAIIVDIRIYDIRGSLVATIAGVVNKAGAAYPEENNGVTLAEWNATNQAGRAVASGVYLYYLHARDATNGTIATFTGKLSIVH